MMVIAMLVVPPARAQQPSAGRITGTITEKISSRPVQFVSISIAREGADSAEALEAHPDVKGRFSIDGVAVGRYVVRVTTPLLDSLGLALPEREVNVGSGETVHLDYALPFGSALRDAVCPGLTLARGKGVVAGHVTDAGTDLPLPAADVVVSWTELVVDRSTLKTSALEHTASVKTRARGEYRLCGVPTATSLSVQLQLGDRVAPAVRLLVSDDEGAVASYLSLGAPPAGADRAGGASITGVVRGAGGVPLAGAQLRVQDGSAAASTDSTGRYFLSGLPDGTQILLVRRLGYAVAEVPVELRGNRSVVRDVQLERATTLDTIVVSDYRTRYREFEFNRGMYIMAGDFLTADMIARRKAQPETGDLVDRMPGFHVVGHGGVAKAFTQRVLQRGSSCKANVVVDGVEEMGVNDVPPNMIQGIEVYVNPPKPSIYHREGCGLVVIWTKNWRRPTRSVPVSADTSARSIQ